MAARQRLSRLSRRGWETFDSPDNTEMAEAHKNLLNINPEAGLLRQAECVLNDGKMLRHIKSVRQKVLKQFHLQMAKMVMPAADLEVGDTSRLRSLADVRRAMGNIARDEMLSGKERSAALWTLSCADDFDVFFEEQYQRLDSIHAATELCLSQVCESGSRCFSVLTRLVVRSSRHSWIPNKHTHASSLRGSQLQRASKSPTRESRSWYFPC